ncbi:hypothetical protein FACS1894101_3410 [Betaproteobacteria bacterium]|nr:hypothetical protein FACS1894101_3410 [Betaproteobacteria bacterium]
MLRQPPALDGSPYSLCLLGLGLAMSIQVVCVFLIWRQWLAAAVFKHAPWRTPWLALGLGILFLLRQCWSALEFSLVTGVYDVAAVCNQLIAALFILLAVIGFSSTRTSG